MMQENIEITFKQETVDNLLAFSELLGKDIDTMLEEALTEYFERQQQKLIEKGIEEDASMTNLDYDEFWDGVEVG